MRGSGKPHELGGRRGISDAYLGIAETSDSPGMGQKEWSRVACPARL